MAERTVGWSPNPNKANILRNDPDFQASGTRFSAEGRNALAKAHTARRNGHVLELFFTLSALASRAKSSKIARLQEVRTSTVSCTAAILQRHSYDGPDHAAHFMPGQLRLNGLPAWEYTQSSVARLYLMDMFADVERLHANFNRADSAAESGPEGLKALTAQCAIRIVRDVTVPTGGNANRQFVWNIYNGLWLPGVEHSLDVALENKSAKPQVPGILYQTPTFNPNDPASFDPRMITNLQQIGEAGQYEWNIAETIAILRDYKVNATSGPSPADVVPIAQRAEAGVRGHAAVLEND